jgi:drug/metabolite transporter (DMT)-like permease
VIARSRSTDRTRTGLAGRIRGERAALLAVPLLSVLWGLNWPAVRLCLVEIPPWTLRTTGMAAAGLCLLGAALATGRPLFVPRAHWPRLAASGLLALAAFNLLLAFAQLHAATSRAAIVAFTMPVWTALLAWPVLGERPDRGRLLGLGLGLIGLAALSLPLLREGALTIGLLWALLGGMSWAAGTVVAKRWPVGAPAITVAAWQLLVGAAAAGLGMLAFEGVPRPGPVGPVTAAALAWHVLLAQALAYLLWFAVLPRLGAGTATLGTLLVPAVGVLGATAVLGERPTAADLAGLALVTTAAATILLPRSPAGR